MIDWNEGYTIESYRFMRVNEDTWMDSYRVPGIKGASIDKDATDDTPLLETSSVTLGVTPDDPPFENGWYRLEALCVDSLGAFERIALCTMLYEKGTSESDAVRTELDLTGKSVLKPASDRKFLAGSYIPKGANGAEYAAGLLRETFPGPVEVVGSFSMDDYLVFSAGASYLQVVWRVLQAAGWCIQIDGTGAITILEKPKTPSLTMNEETLSVLKPGVTRSFDLDSVPNRYYAAYYDETAIATNIDPDSEVSYQRRNRWVDVVDTSPSRINGETVYAYARRRLEEESTVVETYSYERKFDPDTRPFDMLSASLPRLEFEGDLRILTQRITCGNYITLSEKAGAEVKLWQA